MKVVCLLTASNQVRWGIAATRISERKRRIILSISRESIKNREGAGLWVSLELVSRWRYIRRVPEDGTKGEARWTTLKQRK